MTVRSQATAKLKIASLEKPVLGQVPSRVLNAPESIRSNPVAKKFEIGEILFAQFSCPDELAIIWTQTDYLIHVLSGTATWKTSTETWSAEAGQTIFFKKGVLVSPQHLGHDLCIQTFFIPDEFVRVTVKELAAEVPATSEPVCDREIAIRVNDDLALATFFEAMKVYFAADETPPEALLKLKLKELLISILLGKSNQLLSAYFRSLAALEAPSLVAIMETNFLHNLPLEAFAQMCHRSLSSFKREFRKHYGTSPGRWLLERRLECSAALLRTTQMSVTEIMFESGFEDLSHFSKAFKEKFGQSPRFYRKVPEGTA